MYKMISEYGNEVAYAADEAKKEHYLSLGFKIVEEAPEDKEIPEKEKKEE